MSIKIKKAFAKIAGLLSLSIAFSIVAAPAPVYADELAQSQEAQWLDHGMGLSALNFDGNMYLPLHGAFAAMGAEIVPFPEGQKEKLQIVSSAGSHELYRRDINGVPHIASDANGAWYPMVRQDDVSYISLAFLQSISARALAVTGDVLNIIDFAPVYNEQGENTNPIWNSKLKAYSNLPQGIVATAQTYLGVPYVYGGMSPAGFDCSGFTSYVYAKHGLGLPRTAASQRNAARWISEAEARPGDLVFWGYPSYHVGIYLGNGNYIHSPAPGQGVKIQHKSSYAFSSLGRIG